MLGSWSPRHIWDVENSCVRIAPSRQTTSSWGEVTPPELDSGELAGSNPAYSTDMVIIAQSAEYQTVNLVVVGSNPTFHPKNAKGGLGNKSSNRLSVKWFFENLVIN